MATLAEAARHVYLDEVKFSELVDNGVVERNADGSFDLEAVRRGYLRHVRIIVGEAPDESDAGGINLPWRQ